MSDLAIPWWVWMVAGLGMMAMEAFTPAGFYLFFVGLAGIFTGSLAALGIAPTLLTQGMAVLVGIGVALILRKPTLQLFKLAPAQDSVDSLVGETAIILNAAVAPGSIGKAELRGSAWSARNVGTTELPPGARCFIERVDGLTLDVRKSS